MSRLRWRDLLQVAATLAMLAIAWRIAGGAELLVRLRGVELGWLVLALALTLPMHGLSALRWCYTARRLGLRLGYRRAVAEYYVASFLNGVLPSGVAGDAVRVWRHGGSQPGRGRGRYQAALHAVILERTAGQLALACVLAAGLAANPLLLAKLGPVAFGLVAAVLVLSLAVALAASFSLGRGAPLTRYRTLLACAQRAFLPARAACAQLLLSLVVVGLYLAIFYAAARSVGAPPGPRVLLLGVPLALYAMALPVSIGGLGPRELTAAALWPLLGLPSADGAAAALMYGVVVLLGSAPALVLLRWTPAPPPSAASRWAPHE